MLFIVCFVRSPFRRLFPPPTAVYHLANTAQQFLVTWCNPHHLSAPHSSMSPLLPRSAWPHGRLALTATGLQSVQRDGSVPATSWLDVASQVLDLPKLLNGSALVASQAPERSSSEQRSLPSSRAWRRLASMRPLAPQKAVCAARTQVVACLASCQAPWCCTTIRAGSAAASGVLFDKRDAVRGAPASGSEREAGQRVRSGLRAETDREAPAGDRAAPADERAQRYVGSSRWSASLEP